MTTTEQNENNVEEMADMDMGATFAEMLDDYTYVSPQRGQILQGEVIRIEDDAIFMNVGAKRDAIVPHTDLDLLTDEMLKSIKRGAEIPVYVLKTPSGDEELLVSINKGLEQKDWNQADTLMETEETVELDIVGYNKGGLLVQFGQLQGFVPNSHVPDLRYGGNNAQIESRKARKVGERLLLKVLEVNQPRRRLIFSAKAAHKEQRKRRLQDLQVGEVVEGRVANIVKYGAFVDLGGGVSGLLHVSEMAWHRVDHPSEELNVGAEIEVQIQEVDVEQERVSLSRKAVLPNPWDTIEERHNIGDLIAGTVTNVEDFGAFVEVQNGVVGLVHVSEVDIYGPATIQDIIRPGDEVLVRIIDIDPLEERLSLSIRRVTSEEQIAWMRQQQEQQETEAAAAEEAAMEMDDVADTDAAFADETFETAEVEETEAPAAEEMATDVGDVTETEARVAEEATETTEVEETEAPAAEEVAAEVGDVTETEAPVAEETTETAEVEETEAPVADQTTEMAKVEETEVPVADETAEMAEVEETEAPVADETAETAEVEETEAPAAGATSETATDETTASVDDEAEAASAPADDVMAATDAEEAPAVAGEAEENEPVAATSDTSDSDEEMVGQETAPETESSGA